MRALPALAFVAAADASAAVPDLAALTSSPLGAWTVFAIAITLVIVLLLWYAVDDEQPDVRGTLTDAPKRRSRAPKSAEDRRAA